MESTRGLEEDGWKDRDNVSLKATFTPDDLSDPLIYNPNNL